VAKDSRQCGAGICVQMHASGAVAVVGPGRRDGAIAPLCTQGRLKLQFQDQDLSNSGRGAECVHVNKCLICL